MTAHAEGKQIFQFQKHFKGLNSILKKVYYKLEVYTYIFEWKLLS